MRAISPLFKPRPIRVPGYDLQRQAISELALGPSGWILNAAFCMMAAGIATFVLTISAMFAAICPLRRTPAWASFARPTEVWAFVATAEFVSLGPGVTGVSHFGWCQRAMAAGFMSWLIVITVLA